MAPSATPPAAGHGSSPQDASALALPPSIISMRSILDEEVEPRQLVSIIGLVKDFSPPIETRGTDYKAKMWLYDASLQEDGDIFEVSIFRPEKEIPIVGPGDVVYMKSTRVQRFRSDPLSCLSNWETRIHVFKASQIPKPPACAARALAKGPGLASTRPEQEILQFVSALYHTIDKARVPDHEVFKVAADQALHTRDKFRELRNVNPSTFSDLVVRVVKPPYDKGDYVTLWVTDFTQNDAFYQFSEHGASDGLYADPMGYGQTADQGWEGPLGKMSLQITCWEPHASAIRRRVTTGTYVLLRNVQIKFGRNEANLEGYLRGDQRYPSKVNVDVLDPPEDPEDYVDPRLKELLRRKRDYERAQKRLEKASPKEEESKKDTSEAEAPNNGKPRRTKKKPEEAVSKKEEPKKRKNEGEARDNAKSRRKERRKARQHKEESSQEDRKKLNELVCSEDMGVASVSVSSIFEPVYYHVTVEGQDPIRVVLPFSNVKYRVVVRVVDFSPNTLEEFTVAGRPSEYKCLSDDDEDTSGYDADSADESATWEWRFKLLLEDASTRAVSKPGRVWVTVDNAAAEHLTGLIASDLRYDTQGTANLRVQMAKLWGNLEERKRKLAEQKAAKSKGKEDYPAEDTDEETPKAPPGDPLEELDNEPFSCCLKQYGTKTKESDPRKADAGDGMRWERRYALSGTKVEYLDVDESE